MNKAIADFAEKAGIDIRHIEKHADELFGETLNEFTRLVVNECIMLTLMECQKQELDANPFARRMWNKFGIQYTKDDKYDLPE